MRGRTDPAARASSLRADAEALADSPTWPAGRHSNQSPPPGWRAEGGEVVVAPLAAQLIPAHGAEPSHRRHGGPTTRSVRKHGVIRVPGRFGYRRWRGPGHPSLVSAAEPPLRLVPWTQRHPGRVPASSWDCDEPAGLRRAATGCRKPSPGCSRSRLSSASPSSGPLGSRPGPGPGGTESEPMVEGPGSRAAVRHPEPEPPRALAPSPSGDGSDQRISRSGAPSSGIHPHREHIALVVGCARIRPARDEACRTPVTPSEEPG